MAPSSDETRARVLGTALSLAVSLVAALLATAVVVQGEGWPHNHEGPATFQRTEWFRRAFAAGDWWPTWTPFCFNGHGSPAPFFYHRLYYTVSGALALSTSSSRTGALLALLGFLVVGGAGIAQVGRELRWPRWTASSAAVLFILAPYTITNWLVRGAMAELTAAMLVPWLLLYCFRLVRGDRVALGLGLVYTLLFYAHIVIWLYSAFVLLCFAVAALLAERRRTAEGRRAPVVRSLLGAGALTVALTGFHALAVYRLGDSFNLQRFEIFHPAEQFQAPLRYLWDGSYTWGSSWRGQSVELGRGLLLSVAFLVPLALWVRARFDWWRMGPLLALLGLCALLQLEVSAPFYQHVPLARLLQFPWRLLTLLTAAFVVLIGELAATVLRARRGPTAWLVTGGMACAVAFQASFALSAQRLEYGRFSRAQLAFWLTQLDGPWSSGEYLVRGFDIGSVPPRAPFLRLTDCQLMEQAPDRDLSEPFHFGRIELVVASEGRCALHFSQFVNPFVGVEGVEREAIHPSPQGTYEVSLAPGVHRVAFERRGVLEALLAKP
jgi:hypothetical protein